MVEMFSADPMLVEKLKKDPISILKDTATKAEAITPAYIGDRYLYRIAIGVLSLLALLTAIGSIVLVLGGKTIPEVLVALGSAAVGALVGLFAPSPTAK
jgi:hypothetical protein